VVFAATLLLIGHLDQPKAGALRRSPTQTEFVRGHISEEVRAPLPCDATGLPRRATGFRPSTEALGSRLIRRPRSARAARRRAR
jgi:hypothetical protein